MRARGAAVVRPVGGSGRLRIAVEMFITLTRHAETATTIEGQQHPQRERDHEAAQRDGELDLEPLVGVRRRERARHDGDHPERDERTEQRADDAPPPGRTRHLRT